MTEPLESVHRHDAYITRRFEAIMSHEDNADVSRMLTLGLATADPERPAEGPQVAEEVRGTYTVLPVVRRGTNRSRVAPLRFVDKDRDALVAAHYASEDREDVVVLHVNSEAVLIPTAQLGALVAWLSARMRGE